MVQAPQIKVLLGIFLLFSISAPIFTGAQSAPRQSVDVKSAASALNDFFLKNNITPTDQQKITDAAIESLQTGREITVTLKGGKIIKVFRILGKVAKVGAVGYIGLKLVTEDVNDPIGALITIGGSLVELSDLFFSYDIYGKHYASGPFYETPFSKSKLALIEKKLGFKIGPEGLKQLEGCFENNNFEFCYIKLDGKTYLIDKRKIRSELIAVKQFKEKELEEVTSPTKILLNWWNKQSRGLQLEMDRQRVIAWEAIQRDIAEGKWPKLLHLFGSPQLKNLIVNKINFYNNQLDKAESENNFTEDERAQMMDLLVKFSNFLVDYEKWSQSNLLKGIPEPTLPATVL